MSAKSEFQRKTVFFSGNVQGVGFRYRTYQTAQAFDVGGFVRNLSDGRVEVLVEGESAVIERFIQAVRADMQDYIRSVDAHTSPGTREFREFEIRS